MCDYSLMNLPNRLANEGEILITHRFSTGSIGFVSPEELRNAQPPSPCVPSGFWSKVGAWFRGPAHSVVPPVCIPPGARLKLQSISERVRGMLDAAPGEVVVFTQVTASWNQFRDALRTRARREIPLQSVGEGLQIQVVSLALANEVQLEHPEMQRPRISVSALRRSARAARGVPHWSTFIGTW
jgi:hypothetical protein